MGVYLDLMSGTSLDAIDAARMVRPSVGGFDTGPNRWLDAWFTRHRGVASDHNGREPFNRSWPQGKLGLDPDYVDAIAFAWFAERTLSGKPLSTAGARGARILGGI